MNEYFKAFDTLADTVQTETGQRPFIEHTGGGHFTVFLPLNPNDTSASTFNPTICLANYWWDHIDGARYETGEPTLSIFPDEDNPQHSTDLYMGVDFDSPNYLTWAEFEQQFRDQLKTSKHTEEDQLATHEMADKIIHIWEAWQQIRDNTPEGTTLHDCADHDWDHHYDPDTTLGDYYTCTECGQLTQVG